MSKYLLKNCNIANFDNLKVKRQDILIKDDIIEKIADKIDNINGEYTVVDSKGKLALPGFVDAHTHMLQTFLKGPMDDYCITDWLVRMFSIEDLMTEEDHYYSVLVGCMESLRFGTTAINDMCGYKYIDATIQAMRDSGIRATVGLSATDIAENDKTPVMGIDAALKQAEEMYSRFNGLDAGMITTSVAPPGLPACTEALMQELKRFADQRGLVFHCHLGEGKKETMDVARRTGCGGEAEVLYRAGLLAPNTLLAHSIWLEDFELDLIKECDANPVHCPNTNMKISDGIPKIQPMLDLGINVCMGCDGEASSSTRDMIREGRAGSYLQKVVTLNPQAMDAGTTFKMMTINGAKALGYKNAGILKEGYKADIVLVDMSRDISLTNHEHRINNLLYAGTGHAVDTVFCNGKLIINGGENIRNNTSRILAKSEELLSKLNKKIALL